MDIMNIPELANRYREESNASLGYPISTDYDYSELLPLLMSPLNNVGDPYEKGHYHVNSLDYEKEVVDWFANLFNIGNEKYWGYVTNGGTEGNMYGLYLAREAYQDGIVYYSQDTHYSVAKTVHLLGMKHIVVKSLVSGEMDLADLKSVLSSHRDHPAIICANIGTTMKGAYDDVGRIKYVLRECAIHRFYIHCDAALGGLILPFLEQGNKPMFDFSHGADSITVSGHKMIGMPMPSGVVVAKDRYVERVRTRIEYINSTDTTLSGSRNGLTPLFLHYAISKYGHKGFADRVSRMMDVAVHAELSICKSKRNPFSNIVYFPTPSKAVVNKWQLATQDNIAHIVVMPGVTKEKVDSLVEDLTEDEHGGV